MGEDSEKAFDRYVEWMFGIVQVGVSVMLFLCWNMCEDGAVFRWDFELCKRAAVVKSSCFPLGLR